VSTSDPVEDELVDALEDLRSEHPVPHGDLAELIREWVQR